MEGLMSRDQTRIDGVKIRELKRNMDERGELVEIFRRDWARFFDKEPAMSYFSVTRPGAIRTWHRHSAGHIDYFVVLRGQMNVAVYDDRENSQSRGTVNDFVLGEQNMALLRVPGDCWHGMQCIGETPAIHVSFATELYDYENPDKERVDPHDNDIPYDWDMELQEE